MKYFGTLAALATFMAITLVAACSKDKEAPPPPNLGNTTWKDSAIINGIKYKPFTVQFNEDGTAQVTFAGFSPFKGFWNKLPTSAVVNIYFTESATNTWKGRGTLSTDNTKIESGTLERLTPSTITGTFVVTKQ
jgi:hypothetical protein